MPRIGSMLGFALLAASLASSGGCAGLNIPKPSVPGFTSNDPPGTPGWWRSHKSKAVFVPGSGFQVADTPGFFDYDGRPINSKVAKVLEKDTGGGLLGDVGFQKKVDGIKEQVGLGPNQAQAKLDYEAGQELFRQEHYSQAISKFKKAYKAWPNSALEQDAMFMLGEAYFFNEKYKASTNTFEKLVHKYPNSPHLDKIVSREFAIARYWEQYNEYNPNLPITPNFVDNKRPLFDTVGYAMKNYEYIRLNDPTGPLADDAVMAAANSYFLRGRYNEADEQYALLRKEYPRSEHQYNAHILGLQAKLRRYQGSEYDGTPLEESQKLIVQLKQQFGNELDADQKQRLATTDAQIAKELAQRDFDMGVYYQDLKEYGSAKFYFADVLKRHAGTPYADEARTRLASMDGLPDRPTSRIEPLLKLVPQNAERAAIAQVPMVEGADSTRVAEADQAAKTATSKNAAGTNGTTAK